MLFDLIFAAIIIIAICSGWRKGAAKTLLSFCSFLAAIVFAILLAHPLSQLIYDTFIKTALESKIAQFVVESPAGAIVFEAAAFLASMPKMLLPVLDLLGTAENLTSNFTSFADSANTATIQIAETIAPAITTVMTGIVCILLFVILRLVLRFVAKGIAKVFSLPLLRFPDSLLGSAVGLLKGAIVVLAVFVLLKLLHPFLYEHLSFVYRALGDSVIASFITENGILDLLINNLIYRI